MKKRKIKNFKTKKRMNFMIVFLLLDLMIFLVAFRTSNASYTSKAIGQTEMNVALYAFSYSGLNDDTINIELGDIAPGESKTYKFTVSNQNVSGDIADTDILYTLKMITTNNLGLEYSLVKGSSNSSNADENELITEDGVLSTDAFGTEFVYYTFPDVCMKYGELLEDNYTLTVTLPSNYPNSKQDLVESIKIQLVSKQVIDGEKCGA